MSALLSTLNDLRTRLDAMRSTAAQRREHNLAMRDPGVRDEHFIARDRAVAAGLGDCPYCEV